MILDPDPVRVAGARFYLAEDYHQKYYLRHHPLMIELSKYTPRQLVDSTLAARLRGWIGTRQPDKAEAFLRGTARVSGRATRGTTLLRSTRRSMHLD